MHPICFTRRCVHYEWWTRASKNGQSFSHQIIFEAISEVDNDDESNWVRCHLKEHILVHNPTKEEFKILIFTGKNWRGNHEHSYYLETALTFCIPLAQANTNSWQHVKSIGVWHFSLARRYQLPIALWKYPSHPLFDSANRRGVACIFITPERSASNEPHAYMYVFCANQIECAARCMQPSPCVVGHTIRMHVFTAKLGSVPACSERIYIHCVVCPTMHGLASCIQRACKQITSWTVSRQGSIRTPCAAQLCTTTSQ